MVLSSGILIKSEYSLDDFINIFGLYFEIAFTLEGSLKYLLIMGDIYEKEEGIYPNYK